MKVISSPDEMRQTSAAAKTSFQAVALVATMGCLHDGHVSLIREAQKLSEFVVVSIFVNPTQFGPGEDLDRYPRDLEADLATCREQQVDAVFAPSVEDMYGAGKGVYVGEDVVSSTLCGRARPGHFRGVLTVVAKLFIIIQPDVTVFGQKDAQQARLVQRMIAELDFPINFHLAPIIRESDGLAMSSRNRYLGDAARACALGLHKALTFARSAYDKGERQADVLRQGMESICLQDTAFVEVEYIACVDYTDFAPVDCVGPGTLIALAMHVDGTRLIDNIIL